MNDTDESPWIFAGNCPVCQSGLRRIRVCKMASGALRGYVMCDDCEAVWLSPKPESSYQFPHAEKPECPVSGGPLYGPQSRWASVADVQALGWMDQVTIDYATEPRTDSQYHSVLVELDDIADDLDAPTVLQSMNRIPTLEVNQNTLREAACPDKDDAGYGSDEPRPGC